METAFYCISSEIYFLGAAGMINSLRLNGHTEPIFVLDYGLRADQRELLAPHATIVPAPPDRPPHLLKSVAPLAHPAEVMVLIDADMIVTRGLGELMERARSGEVVAFENNMDRFVPEWGELLDLGPIRRGPYVSSGLVFLGGDQGREVIRLLDDRVGSSEFDLGFDFTRPDSPEHPLRFLDQDVLNAILARAEGPPLVALEAPLAPTQPFRDLRVHDARTLRCAYPDGTEPYVLHHYLRKPWLERMYHGVYSQLLARLLLGDDVAIKVPETDVPLRMRDGALARAGRTIVNVADLSRWYLGDVLPERLAALRRRRAAGRT